MIQTLMEMDCIPAGMELFPAADEEQWEFIKRVIDDCDYYILIIGGRYGSLTPEGISYTEKEYEYAMSVGLKVLAFVHNRPDDIPVGKSDIDPDLRRKLEAFRTTVSTGRLVKFWNSATELPGLVALSLSKTIKVYPAVGWVRARTMADEDLLMDLNDLRKENDLLRRRVLDMEARQPPNDLNLAGLAEAFTVNLTWLTSGQHAYRKREPVQATWSEIFAAIAAEMIDHPNDALANSRMASALYRSKKGQPDAPHTLHIDHDDFQTIRLQLTTLGLINVQYTKTTDGKMALFWVLTNVGERLLKQLRTVKSAQ